MSPPRPSRAARRAALQMMLALAVFSLPGAALGCDICAVYTGFEVQATEKGLRLGLAEQFTRFATLQENDVEVANPFGERMESSITQFLFGWQFNRRFGAQVIVPVISRDYRRVTAIGAISGRPTIESGDVTGFGDVALLGNALLYDYTSEETLALVTFYTGLELPSGDSGLLAGEVPSGEPVAGIPVRPSRGAAADLPPLPESSGGGAHFSGVPSGIHGHDLALGSGSVDGIFALRTFGYWRRFYAEGSLQYYLRGTGSYDYKYANLFVASLGPGYFALSEDDYTLGMRALFTVETKGKDTVEGQSVEDTGYTGFYGGPALNFTWSTALSADLAFERPLIQDNTGLQIVPDWRLRAGAVWRW